MSTQRSFGFALGCAAVVALLAGCAAGGSPSSGVTPGTVPGATSVQRVAGFGAFNTLTARVAVKAVHPFAGRLLPATGQPGARFFISDAGDETVDVIKYDGLEQLAQITGLSEPQGMCNHKKSVWVANTGGSNLIRYSPAGKGIGMLADAGQFPVGCAFDRPGDLAAANIMSTSSGPGSVSIWEHATGNPKNYPLPDGDRAYFITYDPQGDLFVDGSNASGAFVLYELPRGGSTLVPITLVGATIHFPGGLQYADGALDIGDQAGSGGHSVVYQAHVVGRIARVVKLTELHDAFDAVQTCITPFATIIVVDAANLDVEIYAYPAGGNPIHTISGFGQPIGCAFSP
jgi:hypothetical protein